MKTKGKTGLICILLLWFAAAVKAQTTAGSFATATIVNPVGISSGSQNPFIEVSTKTGNNKVWNENNKKEITTSEFSIDADVNAVYQISMPAALALRNMNGNSTIVAFINPRPAEQVLPNGQKQFMVDSELVLNNDRATGKHSSSPFEVTVNFN